MSESGLRTEGAISPFEPGRAPRVVLFDLDGTLIDSVPSLARAVDIMLQSLGRESAGENAVRQWVGNGAPMLVRRALSGSVNARDDLDPSLVEESLALFLEAYADCASDGAVLYPGVREFLEALQQRQIPMAIVTNKPARFVPEILASLQLDGCFELVVGGDCLASRKPHPEPLLHAVRHFEVAPEQALMIGDSCHDVQAARRALMPVAAVTYGYNHGEPIAASSPDWVVDSCMELL